MSILLPGCLWVFGAASGAAVIGYLVRRIGQDEGRPSNNDAAGEVFTIVSGLQAVVLAFVLVTLFDTVTDAREGAFREAQALVSVTWAIDSFSPQTAVEVRRRSAEYAQTVIHSEWPMMRAGQRVSNEGWMQLDQVRTAVLAAPVSSDSDFEQDRKGEALDQLSTVYRERHERVTRAFDRGVVAVVWFVLIAGSLVCVLLPNLFGGTRLLPHIFLVSTLAGALALLLFAIYQLQNPFSGGSAIEPEAFQWALERLGRFGSQ